MSITIKLDRPAMLALIEKDPEFKFELTAAVISEVAQKLFDKDKIKIAEVIRPELFKQAVDACKEEAGMITAIEATLNRYLTERDNRTWGGKISLTKEAQGLVDQAVRSATLSLSVIIEAAVTAAAKERAKELLGDLDDRIAKRAARIVDDEVNKRVDAGIRERLLKAAGA